MPTTPVWQLLCTANIRYCDYHFVNHHARLTVALVTVIMAVSYAMLWQMFPFFWSFGGRTSYGQMWSLLAKNNISAVRQFFSSENFDFRITK